MAFSDCPFCHQIVPSSELERHADNHFVEEELARDADIAQQIAAAPTTLSSITDWENGKGSGCSTSACGRTMGNEEEMHVIIEKISCLTRLQIRATFYKVEGGLLALLRRCLEMESRNSVSILSDFVDHFQSVEVEDSGWGCGWRNIQMLSSHLLLRRLEAREVLFGGSGFVPDIASLQRWLEIAWQRGFDVHGAYSFNRKICGSSKWIGTTECAALFRSFGLKARIVDFGRNKNDSLLSSGYVGVKRKVDQIYGPMDRFLRGRHFGAPKVDSLTEENSISKDCWKNMCPPNQGSTKRSKDSNMKERFEVKKASGHQVLAEWVWNYFHGEDVDKCTDTRLVFVSDKMPLYFQHAGHSRTIVGIQANQVQPGMPRHYTLLVLDPGHRTETLERSLRENFGWQRFIKRGIHTLKKQQYQLCYVDLGLAHLEEIEQLKTVDSVFFES